MNKKKEKMSGPRPLVVPRQSQTDPKQTKVRSSAFAIATNQIFPGVAFKEI